MTGADKSTLARQLWLTYFNRVLRDQEIITEQEYRKMQLVIWKAAAKVR